MKTILGRDNIMATGRSTKCTPELVAELERQIAAGVPDKYACLGVGINRATFYEWMKTKPDFNDIITRARGRFVKSHVANIQQAAAGRPAKYDDQGRLIQSEILPDARHSEWLLERRAPQDFSKAQTVNIGDEPRSGDEKATNEFDGNPEAESMLVRLYRIKHGVGKSGPE